MMLTHQEVRVIVAERQNEDTKWLAMLLRRVGIMIVKEVERRYDLPSSFADKRQ